MTTYKESGVDIDLADRAKAEIKKHVKETFNRQTVVETGFFCGGVEIDCSKYKQPVIMASNDGVGTKMIVAKMAGDYSNVGEDIVNACANDLITSGAEPTMFLDYIASDKINPQVASDIVKGIARTCKKLNIVLVGGETAQMPGTYIAGEHDLAGTVIGLVEKTEIINGKQIEAGDVLIGISSKGLHTNGYSLARAVLFKKHKVTDYSPELGRTIGECLLEPHREYVTLIRELKTHVKLKGIAHITGGGITENLPRILPQGIGAKITKGTFEVQPIFKLIQKEGEVPEADMYRTFNMGVGMIICVNKKDSMSAFMQIKKMNEKCWIIGETIKGSGVDYEEN